MPKRILRVHSSFSLQTQTCSLFFSSHVDIILLCQLHLLETLFLEPSFDFFRFITPIILRIISIPPSVYVTTVFSYHFSTQIQSLFTSQCSPNLPAMFIDILSLLMVNHNVQNAMWLDLRSYLCEPCSWVFEMMQYSPTKNKIESWVRLQIHDVKNTSFRIYLLARIYRFWAYVNTFNRCT